MVISLFVPGTHLVTYNRGRCLTPKNLSQDFIGHHYPCPCTHVPHESNSCLFRYLYNTLSYFVILTFLVCREYPYSRIIHSYVQNYKMAYFLIQIYIQYFLKINSI